MALFKRLIQTVLKKKQGLKVNAVSLGECEIVETSEILPDYKHIANNNGPIYRHINVNKWFSEYIISPIMKKRNDLNEKNSAWSLKALMYIQITIKEFTPQVGFPYIKLIAEI